tara:strand:- start:2131 stop:6144 length:4014 start_codon:yes stop_codon:yes gene_type:complete
MKAIILFILFAMLTISSVFGQIKIGDNPQNIDSSSILELESSSKVFVITRVTSLEMEAITPQRGGMVYNMDTECINYYDGTQWINLCDAVDFNITNDPIVNNRVTIEITQTAEGYNLEIAKNGILGDNIVDGGIGPDDIQDNSIGQNKLAAESVGSSEIRSNAVGSDEIRDGSIAPADIANFIPGQVLTTDENGIVQWEAAGNLQGALGDEFTISGNGTPASPLQISEGVQQNISNNNSLITGHIIADEDTDDTNELVDLTFTKLTNTLSISKSSTPVGASVDLSALVGSDDQELTLTGNILSLEEGGAPIDLSIYANSGSDNQNLGTATLANEQLTIDIENGNPTTANLSAFATDAALSTGLALKENLANKSNNVTLGNSTVLYPTQNAVKVYVDNVVGGSAQTIVSADPNNAIITSANDGGAYYNDGDRNSQNELQDLAFNNSTGILTLTTPGTPNNQANLSGLAGITTLNNGFILVGNGANAPAEVSVSGDATMNNLGEVTIENAAVTPIKIEPGLDGQFLSTVAGAVTWVAEPTGTGGSTELADGITITGDGTTLDRFKIEPSTINGQYLRTDATGNVVWDNLPTGTAGTVTPDGTTIIGDGLATALQVPTGGITSLQILDGTITVDDIADNNITPDKIQQGATGEVLTTDINGDVIWAPINNPANQNASEVPFTPAGNTISTDVQAAITELQTEIDGITITGEVNTASNQGTAGVATFIQKNGVDLEFRSVNAGSNKVTISEDAVNNEILVDIDDINLTITESQISDLTHTIDTDDQNAADVPFTPAGNTTSTDVQAAITELQTEIDGITITGEVNTASNQGTAGVATFIQKNGVDLEFRSVNAGSNKVTILEDAVNNEILVDIDDTNLTITESQISNLTHTINTDNQNAAAVPFTPTGNTTSTDVQAAITELQTEIDGVTAGDNLANTNLEQTETIRTYEIENGESLVFTGLGNVGIGNGANPPQQKFHVAGEIRVEGVNSADGTAGSPAYTFSGDTNNDTGMYRPAADEIGFSVGGYEALRIDEPTTGNTVVIVNDDLELDGVLTDINNTAGTANQILSSTGAGVEWINAPGSGTTYTAGSGIDITNEVISIDETTAVADWSNLTNIPTDIANGDDDTQYTAGTGLVLSAANEFSLNAGTIVADWSNLTGIPIDIADGDDDTVYTAGDGIDITNEVISLDPTSLASGSIPASLIEANPTFNGTVTAFSFTSNTQNYPDYVFQKYFLGKSNLKTDYEFSSLENIETYLKNNHHLPGVKSAEEVAKNNGYWNLTEGALVNLEKIEELFLHTIEQEKKIKELQKANTSMSSELEALKTQMEEIKTMLLEKSNN